MSRLRGLDLTTKIILIFLVVVISYLLLFLVISEVFVQESTSWTGRMDQMMDTSPDYTVVILISLTIALVVGVLVTLWLKPAKTETTVSKTDELEIIKRALSDDEKAVLDEIRRAEEITKILCGLGWSGAKPSSLEF